MSSAHVFLASIPQDGSAGVSFRELGGIADHHTEKGLVSRGPLPGHRTVFTAAAKGDECLIEWFAEAASPLRDAARVARLAHGDGFVLGEIRFLVYVEPADRILGGADPSELRYRDEALRSIEALDEEDLRDALGRFALLPYVARALHDAFVEQTGFVQYRNGRVPRVRESVWAQRGAEVWLRMHLAVWSMFSGEWSEPRITLERRLATHDVDAIADCADVLRAIPPA